MTTWHPLGIFDAALAESVREFVEHEEYIKDAPFNRYTDLSGITEIQINLERLSETARRRRGVLQPVQSAIFADTRHCLVIAQIYESLMEQALAITVRAFREREAAAEWLGVPIAILCPSAKG